MLKELFLFVLQVESLQYAVSFMSNFFYHMVYIHCALPSDQIAVLNHALQDCESDFTFFLVSVFSFFVLSVLQTS